MPSDPTNRASCGTCHVPERNWTDNRVRGVAAAEVDRNTPTLMNARLGRWYGSVSTLSNPWRPEDHGRCH